MSDSVNVNLELYFNHKSIMSDDYAIADKETDNRSIAGTYFLSSMLPESNEKIIIDGINYIFPKKSEEYMDNIICEGQEIRAIDNLYKEIHFLCCGEMESYLENVKLIFDDNTTENVTLLIQDWNDRNYNNWKYCSDSKYEIAIKSKNHFNSIVYIFRSVINIKNSDKVLKMIILPDNPFVHIYAITLVI